MAREIPLSEEERLSLEAKLLRAELLNREIVRLLTERDNLITSINEQLAEIAERHGICGGKLNPIFQDFRLIRLELEAGPTETRADHSSELS